MSILRNQKSDFSLKLSKLLVGEGGSGSQLTKDQTNELEYLQKLNQDAIQDAEVQLKDINSKIDGYTQLWDNLREVRSKSNLKTLIPISDTIDPNTSTTSQTALAYLEGEIKHGNEILVYLGNSYYAERTVDECQPIIQSRLSTLGDRKEVLEKQIYKEEQKRLLGGSSDLELGSHQEGKLLDLQEKGKVVGEGGLMDGEPKTGLPLFPTEPVTEWAEDGTFVIREPIDYEPDPSGSEEGLTGQNSGTKVCDSAVEEEVVDFDDVDTHEPEVDPQHSETAALEQLLKKVAGQNEEASLADQPQIQQTDLGQFSIVEHDTWGQPEVDQRASDKVEGTGDLMGGILEKDPEIRDEMEPKPKKKVSKFKQRLMRNNQDDY